jgi:nucleoid-associated protein YgaU
MTRSRIRGLVYLSLIVFLTLGFPFPASADDAGEAAAAAQQPPSTDYRPIRRLGGSTRFTRPVNTVGELQKTFSQPRIQSDVRAVLEMDNLGASSAEVNRILGGGMVMETTIAPGTRIEWMALRRAGRPATVTRRVWAGAKPLEGYQFVIDNLTETLTFFVPKICGNISLLSREPSREAARRAEEARKAEAAKAEAARQAAEAARKAEDARKAAEAQKEAEARKAAEARLAEEKRKLDEERAAAEARRAEEARKKAEQDRLAAEDEALTLRPFFAGYFGKQQRQYDQEDPAGLGLIRPDNTVPAFGNPLFGVKGGVQVRVFGELESGFMFVPAIGVAINLEEGSRSSLFGDAEVGYAFKRLNGFYLGTGLTLWDITHGDQFTFGWLGTAAIPLWKNSAKMHKLDLSLEWRQFFDRMSDPDVNYQFWGGLRYMFK